MRGDIFSFGAVLYEMVTGQRAFRGESKISTLAAIVEKDPPPASEISSTTPPELERLIARCLRKDVNRRSQNMADVKLALEELRDESESGKLALRPAAVVDAGTRRWVWPAVAMACALVAVAAFIWVYLNSHGTQPRSRIWCDYHRKTGTPTKIRQFRPMADSWPTCRTDPARTSCGCNRWEAATRFN
jgi:serine/threonine protein kinase